jgi:hypothetical protein
VSCQTSTFKGSSRVHHQGLACATPASSSVVASSDTLISSAQSHCRYVPPRIVRSPGLPPRTWPASRRPRSCCQRVRPRLAIGSDPPSVCIRAPHAIRHPSAADRHARVEAVALLEPPASLRFHQRAQVRPGRWARRPRLVQGRFSLIISSTSSPRPASTAFAE